MNNVPLVTVVVCTYNSSLYIEQTLKSITSQIVNFKVEVFISDDFSSDNTTEIINDFELSLKSSSNFKIRKRYRNCNVGASINGPAAINDSNSRYISLCDGDDYWIDPYKLQKQVDFLEQNLDYSFCSTNIHVFNLKNKLFSKTDASELIQNESYHDSDLIHFLNPYVWYTCTVVFRKSILDKHVIFDKKIKNFKDIFLFSILLKEGKCRFMNEFTSVYRIHNNGIWSTISSYDQIKQNNLTFGSMAYYHQVKIKLINESYLYGLIDLYKHEETTIIMKIIYFMKFLFFCIYSRSYFTLFKREFLYCRK